MIRVDILNSAIFSVGSIYVGCNALGSETSVSRAEWSAWSVRCRLCSELCKVEIASSTITHSHRLAKLSLGVEAVEDNSVDGNGEDLNNNLDDGAYQRPVLETAKKIILDLILEELTSSIVETSPAPHIFAIAI